MEINSSRVNDCLYEIETSLKLDGFGTGNAKNSTGTAPGDILHRGVLWVHLEKLNPWLPTFYTGMDGPASMSSYRQGSSAIGAQLEYDLLSRNNGFNTGRWGNGFGLNWDDKPLSGIRIPGRMTRLNIVYATIGEGDDGLQSFREQRSWSGYVNIEPFSQMKNKWVRGLGFEVLSEQAKPHSTKPAVDCLARICEFEITATAADRRCFARMSKALG